MCSSTFSLTSGLDGVGGQRHAPAALPPGKIRYPLYRRLGQPQGRSGLVRKISPPHGFDPRTVQPVASRYTDCAYYCHYFVFKQISDNICALFFDSHSVEASCPVPDVVAWTSHISLCNIMRRQCHVPFVTFLRFHLTTRATNQISAIGLVIFVTSYPLAISIILLSPSAKVRNSLTPKARIAVTFKFETITH